MTFRNIKYFLVQGFKGVISNSLMSFASICIVVASLVVFGAFLLIGTNLNYLGDQIKDQCEINVYINEKADRDIVREVGSQLSEIENVKDITLYTKEERLEKAKQQYADKADVLAAISKDNPLRDSYILTLKDIGGAGKVVEAAKKIKYVDEVKDAQDVMQKMINITGFIKHASVWILIILAIISIFIISNTIKLGMFARRKEINIMKFVGATNWFIRWPFLIEGVILGILGSAIASAIVLISYNSLLPSVLEFINPLKLKGFWAIHLMVIYSFSALGIGIGMIGSYTSIRRHLHV